MAAKLTRLTHKIAIQLHPLEFPLLDPLLESSLLHRLEFPLLEPLLESSSLSQSESELLPSMGQLSLCPGCVLFCVSSVFSVWSVRLSLWPCS